MLNILLYKPLEQFNINIIYPIFIKISDYLFFDLSITNLTIFGWLIILFFIVIAMTVKNFTIVPNGFQLLVEKLFLFLVDNVNQQLGQEGQKFFGLLVTVFLFILTFNLAGMVCYAFSMTSQLVVNFTLSFAMFIMVTLVGIERHGINYAKLFFPSGVPIQLMPLLVAIEIISYCSRAISLGIRLFANIMAGHTLLVILASFASALGKIHIIAGLIPFMIVFAVTFLEIAIAMLQSYVFLVLVTIYLKDAIFLH